MSNNHMSLAQQFSNRYPEFQVTVTEALPNREKLCSGLQNNTDALGYLRERIKSDNDRQLSSDKYLIFLFGSGGVRDVIAYYWREWEYVNVRFTKDNSCCLIHLPTALQLWKREHVSSRYEEVEIRDSGNFPRQPWMFSHGTLTVDPGRTSFTIPGNRYKEWQRIKKEYYFSTGEKTRWCCW